MEVVGLAPKYIVIIVRVPLMHYCQVPYIRNSTIRCGWKYNNNFSDA